ncbi:hypothetical protein [Nocardia australiensis]|uniref:hypothetical protein n=1 Tax=Nocardia australiensis TaxID=2887191 RepID=UPI001D159851|nr:hypothetical protein [Nocardia australiensis]
MTGTDPDYISSMEHFESMRHEEIYAKTQQIDAAQILNASVVWLEVASTLATSFPLTLAGSDRVLNSMEWVGATADAAYASARSYAASVDELTAIIGQVGARLSGVAAAAEAVKIAVAPPGSSGPIGAVAKLLEAGGIIDAQMAEEALRQEAVLAMNMIYKPAYGAAGTGVPALPEPPALPNEPHPQPLEPGHQPRQSTPEYTDPPAPQSDQRPTTPGNPTPQPGVPANPAPESAPDTTPPVPSNPESQAPQPVPTPTPAPPPQQAPPPPAPETPPPPPAPAPPAPAPQPHPEPAPSLSDPGGQPGITGPIPENQDQQPPSTTNQPGVIPTPNK